MVTGWPLLGRRPELKQLTAALMRVPGGALVVTGPAGVCRTRAGDIPIPCLADTGPVAG